jgi:hypothetical protein
MKTREPLHLLSCSITGCVDELVAILSHEQREPMRLCQRHFDAALSGIDAAEAMMRIEQSRAGYNEAFALLSPVEQWQLEGR